MNAKLIKWVGGFLPAVMLLGAFVLTPGCASEPVSVNAAVVVDGPPPPLVAETVPVSPGVGYYWVGGSWVWAGRWNWEPGRWELPPHPGATWIPHRYVYRNGRHEFVRGGWR